MKRFLLFVFLCFSIFGFSQKKKSKLDVVSNIETRVLVMKAFGNNTLSKDFGAFYGFGFGGQLMTPINFGIGLDYNLLFGDVKYGHQNIFGNLGSQNLTNISLSIIHRDYLSEELFFEESAGFSIYRLKSSLYPGKEKFTEGNGGYNIGLNLVYTLDREDRQQFVFGAKGNGYFSKTYNENPEIKKYYSCSFFAGLSIGYRYNF